MSTVAVTDVLDRTMRDDAFLDQFHTDPDAALSNYDLTTDERAALTTKDDTEIYELLGDAQLGWQVSVVVVVIG